MNHRVLTNKTGAPLLNPETGQVVMPGQSYTAPAEGGIELVSGPRPPIVVKVIASPDAGMTKRPQ